MIHPHTNIQFINDQIGFGVFATSLIPRGTIVYAKDLYEIEVDPEEYQHLHPNLQQSIEKYSYIDEQGKRIVSWDTAKYVNHCCHSNTISTGYGFEIARKDILPGEEITDDYGLFNLEYKMELNCTREGCRGMVEAEDLDRFYPDWDQEIRELLTFINRVDQPLWPILSQYTVGQLQLYLNGDKASYVSVHKLRFRKEGEKDNYTAAIKKITTAPG
jgi:hypothetical protein